MTSTVRTNVRRPVALIAILTIIAATLAINASALAASTGGSVANIDNSNRNQVAATYRRAVEANLGLDSQWNGSVSGCSAGASSASFNSGTVEAINWFRSMAGLRNVAEDPQQSVIAQQASLMMEAQNQLSHSPGTNWNCYSAGGAQAAQTSNLTLGINGVRGVLGQIEDPGASNVAVGHRRWLLFPELETVGIGNTSRASTVRVINDFGPRSTESSWIAWPPAGFVPDDVVFERWSVSYAGGGNVDFSNARVTVTENGRALSANLLPVIDGFGDPTLVFEVPGANPQATGDANYRVQITGISIDGRQADRSYTVTAFDVDSTAPICDGRTATIVGSEHDDVLRGTKGPDVIVGLGGNDTIHGLGGNDIICGGDGNDSVFGGSGNDRLLGGRGSDALKGARGKDVLLGGSGNDKILGEQGADRLLGGQHADVLTGGKGSDQCWGQGTGQPSLSTDSLRCELGR